MIDARPEYLTNIPDAIRYLQSSVERLGASLSEFVGVFYNEKLMRLLGRLKESLKVSFGDTSVFLALTPRLKEPPQISGWYGHSS